MERSRKAADSSAGRAIQLFRLGDVQAFEFIYRSYCEFARSIFLRMLRDPVEAQDAAQDVFVCVFCKINTFRGESAFSSWLYRLTNSVLMRFRKNKQTLISLEEGIEDDGASYSEISAPDLNLSGLLDRIDFAIRNQGVAKRLQNSVPSS